MQRKMQRGMQRPDAAPTDPAEDEQTPPLSSSNEADAGLTVEQVEALIAKAKNSGRMAALSEMRWSREAQGESSGVDVDPTQILKGAGQQGSLLLLRRALDGVPDPRLATLEAQNRELQNRLEQIETQQLVAKQFEQLRADMEQKLEAKIPTTTSTGPVNGGSNSSDKFLIALLEGQQQMNKLFMERFLSSSDPFAILEKGVNTMKGYSSMLHESNLVDLEKHKIDVAAAIRQQDRADRINSSVAEAEDRKAQFEHMTALAQDAFKSLVAPVTTAIGRGIETRVSGGVPPPPTAPPPPALPPALPPQGSMSSPQPAAAPAQGPARPQTREDYLRMSDSELASESAKVQRAAEIVNTRNAWLNEALQARQFQAGQQAAPAGI